MTNSLPSESEAWEDASLAAVGLRCRAVLAQRLDVTQLLVGPYGHRDWRGVAALAGFDRDNIQLLEERDGSPTEAFLDAWGAFGRRKPGNVRLLLQHLELLERFDVIDDIWSLLVSDVESFTRRQNESPLEPLLPSIEDGPVYDAYVCYTEEDRPFVKTLIQRLETPELGIRLFVRERDLQAGVLKYTTFYQLMEKWCRKTIIVLSPEFRKSRECCMQQKFAETIEIQKASQKLIPVIYKPCTLDSSDGLLNMISKINFCKPELQDWGWNTLICSIKSTGQSSFVGQSPQLTSIKAPNVPEELPIPELCTSTKQKAKWYRGLFNRRRSSSTASSGFQSMASTT
ncbi:myeloid differentiation primary response protein MyD88-like [Ornithodoros turicata]|uniref:myeloid differentiation primary response protein MyD88-like n=1 Tax=Ornithodoros turicata TaxID=34597 RepID=UPI00313A077A